MRDIKFRAWEKKERKMFEVAGLSKPKYDNPTQQYRVRLRNDYPGAKNSNYLQEYFELMQYTGLKDKNGVEIYEGDIVQTFNVSYDTPGKEGEKVVSEDTVSSVIFGLGQFRCDDSPLCIQTSNYPNELLDLTEVIGNIMENPELLK